MDMDVDARTKETADTLLGVAFKRHEPSDAATTMNDGLQRWGSTNAAASAPRHTVPPPSSATAGPLSGSIPSRASYSAASDAPFAIQNHASLAQHSIPVAAGPTTNGHQPQHPSTADANTVLSMSSIGFGIDSSASASWGDATEASMRALQDAMERSTLRLPMTMPAQHLLQIKVQLGVPPKQPGSNEPMVVDVSRLTSILPKTIPVLPILVVVGGLFLRGETQGSPSICTAVACIILQSQAPLSMSEQPVARLLHSMASQAAHPSPWASLEVHQSSNSIPSATTQPPPPAPPSTPQHTDVPTFSTITSPTVAAPTSTAIPLPARAQNVVPNTDESPGPPPRKRVHRSTSIEMLAMISEEIRLAGDKRDSMNSTRSEEGMEMVGDRDSQTSEEEAQLRNGNYNYKKLPPGVTTKNNRRLFVKHTYRDHSGEKPQPEEQDLVVIGSSNNRTPNAAFPLKLHETLTQIETDGHGDIIGWMPHGRSFKIHKQKEFAEIILPRYFVMTKKSSFLRQLNLYGFNRFSAGLDQGSYYHEKFLRGMKFLCRRMTRQKVNGNRIRSAGNPDEEPTLVGYPVCPPPAISTSNPVISSMPPNKRFAYVAREEDAYSESYGVAVEQHTEEEADTEDASHSSPPHPRNNGGIVVSFPLKLQRMLDKLEADQNMDIISWLSHGRAFIVHDSDTFVEKLMPVYFNQTKYSSFQRQLHMYNFQRITAGRDKGAYHNPNFQRGRPQMCSKMYRTRVNGKGCRKPGNPSSEPNLYFMEALPPIEPGTAIEVPDGFTEAADDESD
jgi:hypothetical protein